VTRRRADESRPEPGERIGGADQPAGVEPDDGQRRDGDGGAGRRHRGDGGADDRGAEEEHRRGVPLAGVDSGLLLDVAEQRQRQQPEVAHHDAGEAVGDGPADEQQVQRRQPERQRHQKRDEGRTEQPPAVGEQTEQVRRRHDDRVTGEVRRQVGLGVVDEVGGVRRHERRLGVVENVRLSDAGRQREHAHQHERDDSDEPRVEQRRPVVQDCPEVGADRRAASGCHQH